MSARILTKMGILTSFLCEFVHSKCNTSERELNICKRSEARACSLLISARTNLLTARMSSHTLALNILNWQSLHEFSLNTYINVCYSGLICVRAHYQQPGDGRNK